MNVLPRLLFLFNTLPLTVPVATFTFLDKLVSKFIWQNKRPRVRLKVLCACKDKGGLALSHFRSYYWAAQLGKLVSWMRLDIDTKWIHIDQGSVKNISLSTLPFLNSKVRRKLRIQNEYVNHTLKVWEKTRRLLDLPLSLLRAAKITTACDFLPAKMDSGFSHSLFEGMTLRAFSQLQAKYGINSKDLFRYFQIRHYLMTHKEWDKIKEVPSNFERYWIEIAENKMNTKNTILCIYGRIRMDTSVDTLDVKAK